MKRSIFLSYSVLAFSATVLSGCIPGFAPSKKEKVIEAGDVVLLKIDEKPVITRNEFYKELAGMIGQMDPKLLPKDTQRKVLDDLIKFKLVVAAAEKSDVKNDPEFKKAFDEQVARLEELLVSRIFEKKQFDAVVIADAEAKEDFDKHKERYIKEQGGVLVSGVSFKNKEKALAFYDKAKKNLKDFDSVGRKEKDGKFRDFGRVTEKAPAPQQGQGMVSMVPAPIRTAVYKLSKLPSVDVVKDEKETWVIKVSDKKDPEMFEFAEIADRIKNQLRVNKFMKERNAQQDELKDQFKVWVNEAYFVEEKPVVAAKADMPVKSDVSGVAFAKPETVSV